MYTYSLIILIFTWAISYVMMQRAGTGKMPYIRMLPSIKAIDELIGRATEMGRPIHLTTGHGGRGLYTDAAAAHMSGFSLLGYVAKKCAQTDTNLICSVGFAEMIPVAEDVIQQGALMANNPDFFKPSMVRFHVDNWHTFALYTMAMIQEENVAANIMVGNMDSTTAAIIAAGASSHGCMQIGGTLSGGGIAVFIAFCDYILIGEEMPIAGALISDDKETLASLVSSDYSKLLIVLTILIGVLFEFLNASISWIFK